MAIGAVLLASGGLIALDLWLVRNQVKGDTISALTIEFGLKVSFLPYALGVLAGHLCLKQKRDIKLLEVLGIVPAFGVCLTGANWALGYPFWGPLAALLLGVVAGVAFWPNKGAEGE